MARAAARRWLDPETGDYIVESGSPRADATRASQVLLRLRMRRGSCPVAPKLGSRLHTIEKATRGSARLARAHAIEAIADLVERREIREETVDVEVVKLPTGGAAFAITVEFTDSASDRRTVQYTSSVGG